MNTVIYPFLYKQDVRGSRRAWYMERCGARYRMVSGTDGGALTSSQWTRAEGKNAGRANATTPEEQAKSEVAAAYEKKRKEGYAAEGEEPRALVKPMLAQNYEDRRDKIDWGRNRVYSQPKLDGIRCLATADGLFTRRGERIVSCPHLEEAVRRLRAEMPVGPHVVLDGELYNHKLRDDFNEIASMVRRQSCSAKQLARTAELVQFHVYDAAGSDFAFGDRVRLLQTFLGDLGDPRLVAVETLAAAHREALDTIYADYLSRGYEGQMVRLDWVYEHKRSAGLLKRKEFMDEEFEVVSIDEGQGNRSGMAGRVTLRLPDGRTFGAGIAGGTRLNRLLFETAEEYLGTMATVRFQNYTPDGVPRFPVVRDMDRGGF